MVPTNSALRLFDFLLDGDVTLQLPDFIVHERDLGNVTLQGVQNSFKYECFWIVP